MRHNQTDRIYNSRILLPYLKLLREQYPNVNVADILTYSKINPYEIKDETCWFSQHQVDWFYERCMVLTGNPTIARDAGRLAASPGILGVLQLHTFGLLNPQTAFRIINRLSKRLTLSCDYQSRLVGANKVEITATPYPGTNEKPYQCESRKGMFEAVVTGFNFDLPHIEHPECMFDGGSCCRYIISWQRDLASRLSILRNFISSCLIIYVLLGYLYLPLQNYLLFGGFFLSIYLGTALATSKASITQMKRSRETLSSSAEKLEEMMLSNVRNIDLVHKIGRALVDARGVKEVLARAIAAMETSLNFDSGVIMLANDDQSRLEVREMFGFSAQTAAALTGTSFHLDKPDSIGPFVLAYRQKKPYIVDDAKSFNENLSERSRKLITDLNIQSFLCCPILVEDHPRGVVAVTSQTSMRPLTRGDVYLLQGIAPILGLALANAELVERLQERDRMLAEHNRRLESEVALRTRDLVEARDLALAANQAKSRFLANTNHELRTPLQSILGYTALLRDELEMNQTLEADWDLYIETIDKNANILATMINTLLDLAKIEAGQMTLSLEMVEIGSLLTELNSTVQPLMDHNRNRFSVESEVEIGSLFLLDRTRVIQILLNLLSNAAKFTQNGQVTISVKLDRGQLCFTVADTGCGIPLDEVKSIFNAFTQVDPDASRSAKGTGLGLTITREFVELMNGTITVQSELGSGSTFTITLPVLTDEGQGEVIP